MPDIKKHKKCKTAALVLFVLVSLSSYVVGDASMLYTDDLFRGNTGVPFTNWYEVAPWETQVCFNWGGDNDPNSMLGENMDGEIFHNLVVTLQAESRDLLPDEYSAQEGSRLYEVSWYIQPVRSDETMNFEVIIFDNHGIAKVIGSGSSNYVNGFRDYFSEYSSTVYTRAKMRYWNERTEMPPLEVPFMD